MLPTTRLIRALESTAGLEFVFIGTTSIALFSALIFWNESCDWFDPQISSFGLIAIIRVLAPCYASACPLLILGNSMRALVGITIGGTLGSLYVALLRLAYDRPGGMSYNSYVALVFGLPVIVFMSSLKVFQASPVLPLSGIVDPVLGLSVFLAALMYSGTSAAYVRIWKSILSGFIGMVLPCALGFLVDWKRNRSSIWRRRLVDSSKAFCEAFLISAVVGRPLAWSEEAKEATFESMRSGCCSEFYGADFVQAVAMHENVLQKKSEVAKLASSSNEAMKGLAAACSSPPSDPSSGSRSPLQWEDPVLEAASTLWQAVSEVVDNAALTHGGSVREDAAAHSSRLAGELLSWQAAMSTVCRFASSSIPRLEARALLKTCHVTLLLKNWRKLLETGSPPGAAPSWKRALFQGASSSLFVFSYCVIVLFWDMRDDAVDAYALWGIVPGLLLSLECSMRGQWMLEAVRSLQGVVLGGLFGLLVAEWNNASAAAYASQLIIVAFIMLAWQTGTNRKGAYVKHRTAESFLLAFIVVGIANWNDPESNPTALWRVALYRIVLTAGGVFLSFVFGFPSAYSGVVGLEEALSNACQRVVRSGNLLMRRNWGEEGGEEAVFLEVNHSHYAACRRDIDGIKDVLMIASLEGSRLRSWGASSVLSKGFPLENVPLFCTFLECASDFCIALRNVSMTEEGLRGTDLLREKMRTLWEEVGKGVDGSSEKLRRAVVALSGECSMVGGVVFNPGLSSSGLALSGVSQLLLVGRKMVEVGRALDRVRWTRGDTGRGEV